jgi:histo-blood group ABO system transferase
MPKTDSSTYTPKEFAMYLKIVWISLLAFLPFFPTFSIEKQPSKNVGLLIVATGKYISFVNPLIESARKHFCRNHRVTYFVFTDQEFAPPEDVVRIEQKRLGWPYDTMMRYKVYLNHWEKLLEQDYLFACDADMQFVGDVGDEILGERVATLHPGFVGKRGSYETRRNSKAYISEREGTYYFAGGFYGAQKDCFLHILKTTVSRIEDDLKRGIIAVWHDESHWNRYCVDFPPSTVLTPSYCYPESWNLPYEKKLLALDKDHAAFRN